MIIYIKTKEEIEGFKKAGKIANEILNNILNNVEEGKTTKELDTFAISECKRLNVKPAFLGYRNYPAAICASKNNIIVHGIPNNEKLKNGDILSIDFGVDFDGFIGDSADTVIIGKDFSEKSTLLSACKSALENAISVAKEGNKLSDISKQIYKVAKKYKFSIPVEYGGHGISRYFMHANPFIPNIPDEEHSITLHTGMIMAIEPMFILGSDSTTNVCKDGFSVETNNLSVHCEHTVLIGTHCGIALTAGGKDE